METVNIKLSLIDAGNNFRMSLDEKNLESLCGSLSERGQLQNIGVKLIPSTSRYKVLYGNRRYFAAKKLGWPEINCKVFEGEKDIQDVFDHLTENLIRDNPKMFDEGKAFDELARDYDLNSSEIASRLSISKGRVDNALTVFKSNLAEDQRDMIVSSVQGRGKKKSGTVPSGLGIRILNLRKSVPGFNSGHQKTLLKLAAINRRAVKQNLLAYAYAVMQGKEKPEESDKMVTVAIIINLTLKEHDRLQKKYIKSGVFSNIQNLLRSLIAGKISEKISIVGLK